MSTAHPWKTQRHATCGSQKAQRRRPVKARYGEIAKEALTQLLGRFVSTCESLTRSTPKEGPRQDGSLPGKQPQ